MTLVETRPAVRAEQNTKAPSVQSEIPPAVFMLRTSRTEGIKLKPKDIAIHRGYEESSTQTLRSPKDILPPPFKGRKRRLDATVSAIQDKAKHENIQHAGQQILDNELNSSQYSASELAGATLGYQTAGNPLMDAPYLYITKDSGEKDLFYLGGVLNMPDDLSKQLPGNVQASLKDRELFWQQYGFTSGDEVTEYLSKGFKRKTVDFEKGKVPAEFKWLKEAHPEDYNDLKKAAQDGYEIRLTKCKKLPNKVQNAVRHIAEDSQHKFVSTWLPPLVREDRTPVVVENDRIKIKRDGVKRLSKAEKIKKKAEFRGTLMEELAEEDITRALDFGQSVAQITDFIPLMLNVELAGNGNEITPEMRKRLQTINKHLFAGLGREYAYRRFHSEDAKKVSEGGLKILAALAVLGPAVHIAKYELGLKQAGDVAASLGDDSMAEASELRLLKDAGVKLSELLKIRGPIIGPLVPFAVYGSTQVEAVRHAYGDRWAALLFMESALLVSAATCIASSHLFSKGYGALAAEGKLEKYFPSLNEERQEKLEHLLHPDKAGQTTAGQTEQREQEIRETWQLVEDQMKELGISKETIQDRRAMFFNTLQDADTNTLQERITAQPAEWERIKHGIKESMLINMVRAGVASVAIVGPFLGFAAGPLVMMNGLTETAAGGSETTVGLTGSALHTVSEPARWRRFVHKQTELVEQAKQKSRPGEKSVFEANFGV